MAETFDRPMENIFALQSEVAEKVALYLKSELSDEDKTKIDQTPTDNIIANNHYLRGRDQYQSYNAEDNEKSIENYKLALREDPDFSVAMAALSGAYSNAVQVFGTRSYNYLDTALVLAKRSTILSPESVKAWNALGLAYDNMGFIEDAKTMYLTALEKNPNYATSFSNLALILKDEGELVESIKLQNKSIEINPLNPLSYNGLSSDYRRLEMYDKALELLDISYALDPDDWITHYYQAYNHICAGNFENARPYIEKILSADSTNLRYPEIAGELYSYFDPVLSRRYFERVVQSPSFDSRINFFAGVGIGHFLWEEGKLDSANVWLNDVYVKHKKFVQEGSESLTSIMMLASIHSIRKENEEAISLLESVPRTSMDYVSWIRSPMSRSLHNEPKFLDLIEKEKRVLKRMQEQVLQNEVEWARQKG